MRFALATREHADEIAKLRTAAGAALARKHGPGHWAGISTDAGVMRDIRAAHVLVGIARRKIVGTLTLQKKKPWAIDVSYFTTVPRAIYLINMAVLPRRWGKGIGRALLDALIVESEKRGFRQMLAVIGDSANKPSIELHRAAGFRMVGAFENAGFKFGRWLDSVMMQRALGPGATTAP